MCLLMARSCHLEHLEGIPIVPGHPVPGVLPWLGR